MRGSGPLPCDLTVRPPLTDEELLALKKACAPVGLLSFPPVATIRSLRQHGYVEVVLGGLRATPKGLERLLSERHLGRMAKG